MARPVVLRFIGDTVSLERALAKIKAETTATMASLSAASAGLTSFGRGAMSTGRSVSTGLTLPIAAAGAASAVMATNYEDAFAKIEGLVGVNREQIDAWSKDVLELSRTLPQSPRELAEALYFVTSSGIPAAEAMNVLEASARAASAGLGETSVVADAVTSAINAYGAANLSAEAATDVLLATVREGKGEPEELANAIGRVIAPAQALGVSFDQVGGAMASMSLVGLDANEAATALRGTLMALQNPTKEQADALAEMGLTLADVRKKVREEGLLPALKMLAEGARGNEEAISSLFGNVRALNGVLIMTGENSANTARIFDSVAKSTGATDKAFDVAAKSAKFKFGAALSNLQATGIQIGSIMLPILVDIAQHVAAAADWFGKLDPKVQKIAIVGAMAAAAIGPLIFIIGALSVAIGAILTPVGLVVAGIVALATAAVVAYAKVEPFRKAIEQVGLGIRAMFAAFSGEGVTSNGLVGFFEQVGVGARAMADWIGQAVESVRAFIQDNLVPVFVGMAAAVQPTLDELVGVFRAAWDAIVVVVRIATDVVQFVVGFVVEAVKQVWERFGKHLLAHFETAWNAIMQVLRGVLGIIQGVLQVFVGIFTLDWERAWEGVKNIFGGAWDVIVGVLKFALNSISTIIGAVMAGISLAWHAIWSALGFVVKSVWEGITGHVSFAIGVLKSLIGGIGDFVSGAVSGAFDAIPRAFKAALNLVIAAWNRLSFSVPSVDIPGIGKIGGQTIDTPNIPFLAEGGRIISPGLAVVGEEGPEIVRLGAGASVVPLSGGAGASYGGVTVEKGAVQMTFEIDGADLDEEGLADRVVSKVNEQIIPALTRAVRARR